MGIKPSDCFCDVVDKILAHNWSSTISCFEQLDLESRFSQPNWLLFFTQLSVGHHSTSDTYSHAPLFTATPTMSTQGTSQSERAESQISSDPTVHPASPPQLEDNPHRHTAEASSVIRRKAKEVLTHSGDAGDPGDKNVAVLQPAGDGDNGTESSNQLLFHPKEAEEVQRTHLHPSMVEPLWDVRGPSEFNQLQSLICFYLNEAELILLSNPAHAEVFVFFFFLQGTHVKLPSSNLSCVPQLDPEITLKSHTFLVVSTKRCAKEMNLYRVTCPHGEDLRQSFLSFIT